MHTICVREKTNRTIFSFFFTIFFFAESLLAPHRLSQGYAAAAPAGMYGSAAAPTFIAGKKLP